MKLLDTCFWCSIWRSSSLSSGSQLERGKKCLTWLIGLLLACFALFCPVLQESQFLRLPPWQELVCHRWKKRNWLLVQRWVLQPGDKRVALRLFLTTTPGSPRRSRSQWQDIYFRPVSWIIPAVRQEIQPKTTIKKCRAPKPESQIPAAARCLYFY